MLWLYELGVEFWRVLEKLYTNLFELNVLQFLNMDLPWYHPFYSVMETVKIAMDMFPFLGDLANHTVSELLIGFGLIGVLVFRLVKFLVGIVSGS